MKIYLIHVNLSYLKLCIILSLNHELIHLDRKLNVNKKRKNFINKFHVDDYPSTQALQAISGAVVIKFQRPICFPLRITWWTQPGRPLAAISSVGLLCDFGIPPIHTRSVGRTSKRPYSELVELITGRYFPDVEICFRTLSLPACRVLKLVKQETIILKLFLTRYQISVTILFIFLIGLYGYLPFSFDPIPRVIVL